MAGAAAAQSKKDASGQASPEAQKKVAVGGFKGTKNKQVRGWVLEVLRDAGEYEVTDASDVKAAGSDKSYAEAGKSLGVDAIVVGEVSKKYNLVLTVRSAADGSSLGTVEIAGGNQKKLKKAIDNELAIALADPLAQAQAAAPEPEPEAAPPEPPAEASAEEAPADAAPAPADSSSGRPAWLELMAGVRAYNRNFEYNDALADLYPDRNIEPLYTYELPLGPALLLDGRFYPMAIGGSGVAAHIGLQVRFEQGFATRSVYAENTADQMTLETSMQELRGGLRGRIPLGEHELGLFGEYGLHKFHLAGDEDFPLVPDVNYGFIRLGLDARFRISEFLLGFHGAARILTGTGELELAEVWFPGATGRGLDAGVLLGYAVLPSVDVVAGFDYLRYGFDFNAIPDNNVVVAGGATDTYISGWLGVAFRIPGSSSSSDGE